MAQDEVNQDKDEQEPRAGSSGGEGEGLDFHGDPDEVGAVTEGVEEEQSLEGIPWRVAECLLSLRRQINAAAPGRNKLSDGTIGDDNHLKKGFANSDHNPHVREGARGVVTAMDITHDPAGGCDAGKLAASLQSARDSRVKYIIWNRRIANSSPIGSAAAWAWRPYTGSNPHNKHVHISVKPVKSLYDSTSDWTFSLV
ncbi:MAG TPA: hypothetical protein VF718_09865 [Allosphingosinicella sp.]|jgi:hypothetical protein